MSRLMAHRVVYRFAGIFEAPPAMHKAIMDWVEAVVAANNMQAAQDKLERIKNAQKDRQQGIQKALEAAKSFRANPSWSVYKELYEALWVFGHPGPRLKVREFQKLTPEKKKDLEDLAASMLASVETRAAEEARGSQNDLREAEAEVRELKKYTQSGVGPVGDSVKKEFAVDLTGWRYNSPAIEKGVLKQIESEKSMARRLVEKLKGKDDFADMVAELAPQIQAGKGYPSITVQLSMERSKQFRAFWQAGSRLIKLFVPDVARPAEVEKLSETLRHELRHFGQSYLAYVIGNEFKQNPGLPSKKIRTPQYKQQFDPNSQNMQNKERDQLFRKLKQQGVDPSKINWHALDDVEFYTELADSIQDFKRAWSMARSDKPDLNGAVKLWTASVIIPQRVIRDHRSGDATFDEVGGIETFRNFKPQPFFLALRKRARGKWQKAVSEFVKAVT